MPRIINKVCEWCKKGFQVAYKLRAQHFCSHACTALYGHKVKVRRNRVNVICKNCKNTFTTWPSKLAQGRGVYCSKKCYALAMKIVKTGHLLSEKTKIKLSNMRIGNLNPAYIHGQSNSAKKYQGTFPRYIKQKVLQRDNYSCQNCFSTKGLVIHHIDHSSNNSNLENLVTWCRSCHQRHHRLEPSDAPR